MITELKKGNEVEKVILPKQPVILNPANLPEDLDEAAVVKKALEEPIGSKDRKSTRLNSSHRL